jgi:Tetratricopeptide repeat
MLGRVLARVGALTEAREHLDRALLDAKTAFGEHHLFVADTLLGLAELAQLQGDSPTSEDLFRQATSIFEEQYGPDHPHLHYVVTQFGRIS